MVWGWCGSSHPLTVDAGHPDFQVRDRTPTWELLVKIVFGRGRLLEDAFENNYHGNPTPTPDVWKSMASGVHAQCTSGSVGQATKPLRHLEQQLQVPVFQFS